ncbi:alpha/beta fold hydrolase [Flavobacterium sp.]|uniref:alpha/beta hydrolase n=1 Tax=Flavobacterium sp. TaxID=239 RepID=UPI0039E5D40A
MKSFKFNPHTASKLFMLLFSASALAATVEDNGDNSAPKSPIVLVHGAWQGAYVWDQTKTELEKAGYKVSVVKLSGHGDDATPAHQVSLQGYVEQVKSAVNAYKEPVILVGHSLGGAIITQTAAELPQRISKLVYVAGFIPQSGKSVLDYSQMDKGSILGPSIRLSENQTEASIADPETNLGKIFSQDATAEQNKFLLTHYKPEPTIPMGTPLSYDPAQYKAAGKKYYIFTEADQTISYPFQQQMASAAGITDTFKINSGHSPFVSKSGQFIALLKEISKK